MSKTARVIAEADDFRLVRVEDGDRVTYLLELPDGADALGVERWREGKVNGDVAKALFGYVIRQHVKEQNDGTDR